MIDERVRGAFERRRARYWIKGINFVLVKEYGNYHLATENSIQDTFGSLGGRALCGDFVGPLVSDAWAGFDRPTQGWGIGWPVLGPSLQRLLQRVTCSECWWLWEHRSDWKDYPGVT